MMEQSNNQSSFVRIFLKVIRFVGIYLLSILSVYLLGKNGAFANDKPEMSPIIFLLCLMIIAPLVWALSKSFLKGFVRFALVIGVLIVIVRIPNKTESPNALSSSSAQGASSYVGSYSADENGIQVKIMVSPNKWYGEVIEGTTGGLISNEGGDVSDNSLYDQYGTEIGEIRNNSVIMSIQGQRVRLVKD
jgi:hypothetical protein